MANNVTVPNVFRRRLRVLLVENDIISLNEMKKLLESCSYEVTAEEQASVAVSMLEKRRCQFDLIVASIHMIDMDGFAFLKTAVLITNLPIILMSNINDASVALRAIEEGACFFLVKPATVDVLKNLWQHVFQQKRSEMREIEEAAWLVMNQPEKDIIDLDDFTEANNGDSNESNNSKSKEDQGEAEDHMTFDRQKERSKRKSCDEEGESNNETTKKGGEEGTHTTEKKKQPRVTWNNELHLKFLNAIFKLGKEKIMPRKILMLMDVPGLRLTQVASHLQKHRLREQIDQNSSEDDQPMYSNLGTSVPLSQPSKLRLYNRTKFPSFIEQYNPVMFQAGTSVSQNHIAQPLAPTGSMNRYSQGTLTRNNVAAPRGGNPLMNPFGNLEQVPSATGLHIQPSVGSFDTMTQARHGCSSYSPVGNSNMFKAQGWNNSIMGTVENYDTSSMFVQKDTIYNVGVAMPMGGGLHRWNQTGEIVITPKNANQLNSSEIMDDEMSLGSEKSLQLLELSPSIFGTATPSISSSSNGPDPNIIEGAQVCDFSTIPSGQNTENLDDLLEGSIFDDSLFAQQFNGLDFEELFSGQPPGEADVMAKTLDMMDYQPDEGAL